MRRLSKGCRTYRSHRNHALLQHTNAVLSESGFGSPQHARACTVVSGSLECPQTGIPCLRRPIGTRQWALWPHLMGSPSASLSTDGDTPPRPPPPTVPTADATAAPPLAANTIAVLSPAGPGQGRLHPLVVVCDAFTTPCGVLNAADRPARAWAPREALQEMCRLVQRGEGQTGETPPRPVPRGCCWKAAGCWWLLQCLAGSMGVWACGLMRRR